MYKIMTWKPKAAISLDYPKSRHSSIEEGKSPSHMLGPILLEGLRFPITVKAWEIQCHNTHNEKSPSMILIHLIAIITKIRFPLINSHQSKRKVEGI